MLETVFFDVSGDKFFKAFHIFLFLLLKAAPKIPEFRIVPGIGDILVIAQQSVQPLAQFMDEIVVVVFRLPAFIEMSGFSFSYHRLLSLLKSAFSRKRANPGAK
jgi:hypothetical protein